MFANGLSTTKSVTSLLMTHHLDPNIFSSLFGEAIMNEVVTLTLFKAVEGYRNSTVVLKNYLI